MPSSPRELTASYLSQLAQEQRLIANRTGESVSAEVVPLDRIVHFLAGLRDDDPVMAPLGAARDAHGKGLFDGGQLFPLGGDNPVVKAAMACAIEGRIRSDGDDQDARRWLEGWISLVVRHWLA